MSSPNACMQAAACAVMTGALLLLWPLLPESPRWLLARGRRDEAYKVKSHGAVRRPPNCPQLASMHGANLYI